MKLRLLPIFLLLLGIMIFGLTQTDPTQANPNNQVLAVASAPGFTSAIATATPTANSVQPGQVKTPQVTSGPAQTVTNSATTLNAARNMGMGVISVGPAFEQFLEEAGAVAPTPDNQQAADADADTGEGGVEKVSQPVVAEQTEVKSEYGEFDLSRLRLENLLPATVYTASLEGQTAAETVSISSQFTLGASGVIPDVTARVLATEKSAPKLWPVKGPITSTFGPRQTLVIPATTDSATGKGGAGPTGSASGLTVTLPALTPNATTPQTAPVTAAITPTPTPTKPVTTTAATPTTQPTPTPTSQSATRAAQTTVTTTVTAQPVLSLLPVTTTPAISTTPTLTPTPSEPITATATITATPSISATATVSPTVTPTATPFPTGPIPLINGSLPAVGADQEYHTGEDIAVPEGTEVHATADGVVVYAGNGGGYGRVVFIQHADGFMTVYGHNSKLLVTEGEKVKAGQTISLSGSTGYSTGPHVHYEIRYNGKIADPAYFLGLKS